LTRNKESGARSAFDFYFCLLYNIYLIAVEVKTLGASVLIASSAGGNNQRPRVLAAA
jgi:hypothetical protein